MTHKENRDESRFDLMMQLVKYDKSYRSERSKADVKIEDAKKMLAEK